VSRVCDHCGEIYEEEGRLVCPHCGVDIEHTYAAEPDEADFEQGEGEGPGEGKGCGAALLAVAVGIWAIL
jgi:predicted  nucleic acid-binding Zn-ribbon protein